MSARKKRLVKINCRIVANIQSTRLLYVCALLMHVFVKNVRARSKWVRLMLMAVDAFNSFVCIEFLPTDMN